MSLDYYDDCCSERECYECEEKNDTLKSAADYLHGVLEEIYSTSNIDVELLEHNLDNLCHLLKVKMPEGKVQVQRAPQPHPIISEWMQFNHQYLKSCVGQ